MSEELAKYLKTKNGLNRLFVKLKEKYISLGRYSGVVTLRNLSKEECIDIGNLLGYKLYENDTINVSYKELTKKFSETKYSDFSWEELLNAYFNEKIITKKSRLEINNKEEYRFFENIFESQKDTNLKNKLKKIISEKSDLYRYLRQRYYKDKTKLTFDINNILSLLNNIPKEPTPLAVYSAITGNPHYLDLNTTESKLFFKFLSYLKEEEYSNDKTKQINLLSLINVFTDPISNYVITYKLRGNDILNKLSDNKEILNLNLLNILNLEKIDTLEKKVYIFENPAMLNSLSEINVPIVITSGMPNLSLYKLLEKLEETGNKLYYNGDFDPEGLLIADKLKERFPNLKLFCYQEEDYNRLKSNKKISESRLKKLNLIFSQELEIMKKLLLKHKCSAYQEKNIDKIREYIQKDL